MLVGLELGCITEEGDTDLKSKQNWADLITALTLSTAAGMAEWRMRVSSHLDSSGWEGSSPYISRYDTCT